MVGYSHKCFVESPGSATEMAGIEVHAYLEGTACQVGVVRAIAHRFTATQIVP